jgi:ABC-type nitrate/sulfonate/bicarbonate transport system ATPase subunit
MKNTLTLTNISKTFKEYTGRTVHALETVSLEVKEGEFFILLGPSGCGKSTLLRIMSGLEKTFRGECVLGKEITPRDIGFVFQQFSLLPWLTVYENVALGLYARGTDEKTIHAVVMRELTRLGLEKFKDERPKELSGGMRQRVGIARALAVSPKILFLDEPFSALDSFTAAELRKELLAIWEKEKMTIVMVTHNIDEAIELGDRIAVLSARPGKLEKIVDNTLARPRVLRNEDAYTLEDTLLGLVHIEHGH